MPGYVIHIATAQEYLRKHSNNENKEEFIKGVIFPDSTSQKSITHYGRSSSHANIKKFLIEHEIDNSFNRGYFLHLVTDYLFYNFYLDKFSKDIYQDYDIINQQLIDKYDVNLPLEVRNKVFFLTGETKVLSYDLACKVIDEISALDLDSVKNEANDKKWNTYKNV